MRPIVQAKAAACSTPACGLGLAAAWMGRPTACEWRSAALRARHCVCRALHSCPVRAAGCAWAAAAVGWSLAALARQRAAAHSALAVVEVGGEQTADAVRVVVVARRVRYAARQGWRPLLVVDPNYDSQSWPLGIGLSVARRKSCIGQKCVEKRLFLRQKALPPQSSILGR